MLLLVFTLFLNVNSSAQINAYFSKAVFNTPQNQPFLETYLTVVGSELAAMPVKEGFQNSVNVSLVIYKDTGILRANKYNVISPAFTNTNVAPSFIDNQRYALPNGKYILELTLIDNYSPSTKPLVIKSNVEINFSAEGLQNSDIQALESFKKSETPNALSKSGFDLIPYTVNYYPETSNELSFYFETYNADVALGKDKLFIYEYYIETADKFEKLNSYGSFKRQQANSVNPLLARLDISKLGSGNYNLVIELKSAENKTMLQKKYFFARLNKSVDIVALQQYSENKTVHDYFGNCNNVDTLKMFVECLWPIANGLDKERIINQSLAKNPDVMKQFVIDFWQRRAADTANPLNMWANYYRQVQQVMVLFKCGKQKGYYTERGRVYLQYGAPSVRTQMPNEPNTYPYEIWLYYRTSDASTGQFFSNRRFVFASRMLGDDCYNLIHSDMRGEINNPRWQYELIRNGDRGGDNLDNNIPKGTELNQFNEIYQSPR
ncbi:MAG: GWxTD domain-containing protein [Bacteroidetes bacterium]|nr:GWxTD domain-containing protein [Bacteroidota bacterium]